MLDVLRVRMQIKIQLTKSWLTRGGLLARKQTDATPNQRSAHAKAVKAERTARHEIKNDRNDGKKPTNDALQRRGEALTTIRDVRRT